MKHVKGYQTFEATKSKLLGTTLRNVVSKSREKILDFVKAICHQSGGKPVSELDDKYFRYERKSDRSVRLGASEPKTCPKCAGEGYTQTASVTGKKTTVSKKRCGDCDATGLVYEKGNTFYKFWLTEDGRLMDTTVSNGLYYGDMAAASFWETKKVELVNAADLQSREDEKKFLDFHGIVPGETRLALGYGRSWNKKNAIGVFWQDNNGNFHFINDKIGSTKTRGEGISIPGTKWKELGTHHISLDKLCYEESSEKIELNKILGAEPKEDPYAFNSETRVRYGIGGRSVDNNHSAFEGDSEAAKQTDYIISFDYGKYLADTEGQEPIEDKQAARKKAREGATALQNDSEIRKTNLERYRKTVADLNLKEGLGRLINKTPHLMGGANFLLFSMKDSFRYSFETLISSVYKYLEHSEGEDADYYEQEVVKRVKSMIQSNQEKNNEFKETMATIKSRLEQDDPRMAADFSAVTSEFERISRDFRNRYFSKKFETIEQLETISYTIKALDRLDDNQRVVPRYIYKMSDYFTGSMTNNVIDEIVSEWEKNGDFSESLIKMKKLEDTLNFM